VQVIIVVKLR